MANQIIIDIGAVANDGTGDPLRTAFGYVNNNFSNVWATGVANSNVAFDGNKILTTNTNGNLVLAPNGIGKVQANVDIVPNANNTLSLGSLTNKWNTVYTQYLEIGGALTTNDLTVDGNLTVTGNVIQIGNLVTDAKTIQLSNTASSANAANGSGITVGANDDIATMLYSSSSNVWNTNIGITATGNVTAPYFVGNGSLLTGITSYGNANVAAYLPVYTGNISANNVFVTNDLYSKRGSFSGDPVTGDASMYVGSPSFTDLGTDVMAQFTGNVTNYAQINLQNYSNSATASGDYIITADNGNDTTHFLDLGITSSTWDGTQPNSLGNRLGPNDGYLYVQDGDMVIGTSNGNIETWTFGQDGVLTVAGDIIPTANNTQNLGSATYQWNDLYLSNSTIYMNSVPISLGAGNVLTVNGEAVLSNDSNATITTTGNITADYFFGDGSQLTGLSTNSISNGTSNVQIATANGNVTINTNGTYAWTFDDTGNLNLAGDINFNGGGIVQTVDEDFAIRVQDADDDGFAVQQQVDDGSGNVLGSTELQRDRFVVGFAGGSAPQFRFTDIGQLEIPGNIRATEYVDTSLYSVSDNSDNGSVELKVISYMGDVLGSNVRVTQSNATISTSNAQYTWLFDNTGNLTAPGNVSADRILTNSLLSDTDVFVQALDGLVDIRANGNVVIKSADANYEWVFDDAGVLTAPGGISIDGDITGTGSVELQAAPNGNAYVNLDDISDSYIGAAANLYLLADSDNREWIFDTDGTLTTAGDIIVRGDVTGRAAANVLVLKAQPTTDTYIQLNSTVDSTVSIAANLDIVTDSSNTAQTFAFGTDGSLSVPGNITTGNILTDGYFYANGDPFVSSDYGDSNVVTLLSSFGSNTISTTGNITAANFIGNISITGNVTGTSSNVDLVAGSYSWTFDNTGNTLFANGTVSVNDLVADSNISGVTLISTNSVGSEGGEIQLAAPAANTTISGGLVIDSYQDQLRFFESGGTNRGLYVDFAAAPAGVSTAIGYLNIPQVTLSANTTAALADSGKHFYSTTAGDLAILIPTNSNVAFPTGTAFTVVVQAAGNVLVNADSGVTLYMAGSSSAGNRTVGAYGMATVMKVASDTWFINGSGVY